MFVEHAAIWCRLAEASSPFASVPSQPTPGYDCYRITVIFTKCRSPSCHHVITVVIALTARQKCVTRTAPAHATCIAITFTGIHANHISTEQAARFTFAVSAHVANYPLLSP